MNNSTVLSPSRQFHAWIHLLSLGFFILSSSFFPLRAQSSFPYPTLPAELRTPQERGTYLLVHYWDRFDFGDTALVRRPDITEQGFANFIDLLPRIDSVATEQGVEAFVERAFGTSVPPAVRSHFALLADHYLYDPNSPLRSDPLYILFLSRMQHLPTFTAAERERFAYRLRLLAKNQPGTVAADFAYIDRQGHKATLHHTPAELLLLYFHDPDCADCHALTARLRADSLLQASTGLRVLAVYPDADTPHWRDHPQPFPSTWMDAYSPSGEVADRQLYFLRATPSLYLLDRDKRVILKDTTPQALDDYLAARLAAHPVRAAQSTPTPNP